MGKATANNNDRANIVAKALEHVIEKSNRRIRPLCPLVLCKFLRRDLSTKTLQSATYPQKVPLESQKSIDEVAADRQLGIALIYQGKLKEGRDKMQSASEIFSNPKCFENNDATKNVFYFETQISWAEAEAQAGQFDEIKTHLDNASKALAKMPTGPAKDWNAQRLAGLQAPPSPANPPALSGLPQPPNVRGDP